MENEHKKAAKWLSETDPVLSPVIAMYGSFKPVERGDDFTSLVRKIVSQQLSVKAAATIYGRMEVLANERGGVLPEVLNNIDQEMFRSVGISKQKYGYIMDICRHFIESPEFFTHLDKFSDEEVKSRLVSIKGIGEWTAEMFLIFSLGRMDVFSLGDVGLQNAISNLYGFDRKPEKSEMEFISAKWKPYRSIASRYLWASLDNEPD